MSINHNSGNFRLKNGSIEIQNIGLTLIIENVIKNDVTCNSLGDLTVSTSGGIVPLEYSIDGGFTFQAQASNYFSGLSAGTYNMVVRDANLNTASENVIINLIQDPTISGTTNVHPTCETNNGSITVFVTGGTGSIDYNIDFGAYQASNVFSGLSQGTYTVGVRDDNGCSSTKNITLTSASGPTISSLSKVDPTCSNSNGSITVNIAGGTTPLVYNMDGGVYQASNIFGNLVAGTYAMGVRDDNGCKTSKEISLISNESPLDTTIIKTLNTLKAKINNASYQWLDCDEKFKIISEANSQTFMPLETGSYAVEITQGQCRDTSGCHSIIISSNIEKRARLINIFPNPSSGKFKILLANEMNEAKILIVNGIGQIVYDENEIGEEIIEFDFSHKPGLYFMKLSFDDEVINKKILIKNKP